MTTENSEQVQGSARYRIGAVSRLTGISADTLRVWERRYGAVDPGRSAKGGRLYSAEDVARLQMMKTLVDAGDAIGEVAVLSSGLLENRVAALLNADPSGGWLEGDLKSSRVIAVGESIAAMIGNSSTDLAALDVQHTFSDVAQFDAAVEYGSADLLLVEMNTLQKDAAAVIGDMLERAGASHAIVIYRFASDENLDRLPASRCSTMRAPVDPRGLLRHCTAVLKSVNTRREAGKAMSVTLAQPAPARRYDDHTLARLAAMSPTVQCECPRHLAELISSLSAFERYSSECESRNPRDAVLHAFLYTTASNARHLVENALEHVMQAENIEL